MLTRADDFPVHQTADPIAFAGTDRNFYDRYFFNGYAPDGSLFFAAALGVYPALNIMDAAFCVVVDGVQHNLRASRIMHMERMATQVGPIQIDVVEALHSLRVRVACAEHGMSADLLFCSRTPPIAEPRFTHRIGPRTLLDYTRLTQNGSYDGWIEVGGRRLDVDRSFLGTRDRSWGVRPIGAQDPQSILPLQTPQFYWLWAPMNFGDRTTLYHNNSDSAGRAWNTHALMAPLSTGLPHQMKDCTAKLEYKSGTRHARDATIYMHDAQEQNYRIELKPQWNFYMSGLGYTHPEWGHGRFHSELRVGYDTIETANVNEGELLYLHVQAFCIATLHGPQGLERKGCGVLEQLILGPHEPSGFSSLLDGAV